MMESVRSWKALARGFKGENVLANCCWISTVIFFYSLRCFVCTFRLESSFFTKVFLLRWLIGSIVKFKSGVSRIASYSGKSDSLYGVSWNNLLTCILIFFPVSSSYFSFSVWGMPPRYNMAIYLMCSLFDMFLLPNDSKHSLTARSKDRSVLKGYFAALSHLCSSRSLASRSSISFRVIRRSSFFIELAISWYLRWSSISYSSSVSSIFVSSQW